MNSINICCWLFFHKKVPYDFILVNRYDILPNLKISLVNKENSGIVYSKLRTKSVNLSRKHGESFSMNSINNAIGYFFAKTVPCEYHTDLYI